MVSLSVTEAQIGQFTAEFPQNGVPLVVPNQHPGFLNKTGGPPRFGDLQFRSDDLIGTHERLCEMLHHDSRVCRHDAAFPEGAEEPPRLRLDVLRVEPREDGAGDELHVSHLEPGKGDEDERFDGSGLGEEDVGEVDDRDGGEEEEGAEEAAGFHGDEHEVGEGGAGEQESSVEVRGHSLVRPVIGIDAFGDRFEPKVMMSTHIGVARTRDN